MGAAEKLDTTIPFWPAAMGWDMALAYTRVAETQMQEWHRTGAVRFRNRGANGARIALRADLDRALEALFGGARDDGVAEF
jgi:hypothetical protein